MSLHKKCAGLVLSFAFIFCGTANTTLAAGLSPAQVTSILNLLQSFGADQSVVANVAANLGGSAGPKTYTGTGSASAAAPSASGALTFSVSPDLPPQTFTAGTSNVIVAQYIFDASASGEDMSISKIRPIYRSSAGSNPTNCQIYDAATALNTGNNILTALGALEKQEFYVSGEIYRTIVFDAPLLVLKGTKKVLDLKCDIPLSSIFGKFSWGTWGTNLNVNSVVFAKGAKSGISIVPTGQQTNGTEMAISSPNGVIQLGADVASPASQTYPPVKKGQY